MLWPGLSYWYSVGEGVATKWEWGTATRGLARTWDFLFRMCREGATCVMLQKLREGGSQICWMGDCPSVGGQICTDVRLHKWIEWERERLWLDVRAQGGPEEVVYALNELFSLQLTEIRQKIGMSAGFPSVLQAWQRLYFSTCPIKAFSKPNLETQHVRLTQKKSECGSTRYGGGPGDGLTASETAAMPKPIRFGSGQCMDGRPPGSWLCAI